MQARSTTNRTTWLIAAAPVVLGGIWLLGQSRWMRSHVGGLRRAWRLAAGDRGHTAALLDAIIGRRRGELAVALGRPRSAALGPAARRRSIWRGEVWYYPLDPAAQSALAIRFRGNRARSVQIISLGPNPAG